MFNPKPIKDFVIYSNAILDVPYKSLQSSNGYSSGVGIKVGVPYTEDEELYTTFFTPYSKHNSNNKDPA